MSEPREPTLLLVDDEAHILFALRRTLCREGWRLNRGPEEVTLFKNGGGGHLDLFTALFIRERLREGGHG